MIKWLMKNNSDLTEPVTKTTKALFIVVLNRIMPYTGTEMTVHSSILLYHVCYLPGHAT